MTTVRSNSPATELLHQDEVQTETQTEAHPDAGPIALPAWVECAMAYPGQASMAVRTIDGVSVRLRESGTLALCSAAIADASALSATDLREAVARAYRALFLACEPLPTRHWVRMWNFIPAIDALRTGELSSYHVFNQGRADAFQRILGEDSGFADGVPTASGVGHEGRDLVIHALTSTTPGIHLENPRQIPAYRYSARYGPRPPCFARGTIVTGLWRPLLLVGGTASIRDEVSMHAGDVGSQIDETFENLATLLAVARERFARPGDEPDANPLHRFTHVRVYSPGAIAKRAMLEAIGHRFGPGTEIEVVSARLCREELLVEIEGVAELHRSA